MTQDEIIEMANDMAFMGCIWIEDNSNEFKDMIKFAKLVAAKEREACAKVAEDCRYQTHISLTSMPLQNGTAVGIANRIRARGETK